MADMGMYHSLGPEDPNDPNSQNAFRPVAAPPPQGYQQSDPHQQHAPPPQQSPYQQQAAYGAPPPPSPYQQQSQYGAPQYGAPQYGAPQPQSPYGAPPPASPYGAPPPPQQYGGGADMHGLAQQMSQVELMSHQVGTVSKASKKKQRAFHQLDHAPEAATASDPNLPNFYPNVSDSLAQGFLSQQPSPSQHGVAAPPGASQFPMPAANQFQPQQSTDPAAFNARQGAPAPGGKIDPLSIPSIPGARDASVRQFSQNYFPTLARHLPPNALSEFVAQDQGNASPRVCRLTLNAVPATGELLTMTHLPLALMIQPLAKPKAGEEPIPVLDFGEMGPPRCRRCRTYINPFMQFVQGGGKFQCNMCQFPNNEVPSEYFSPVDMAGIRLDRDQRPELTKGTVEFVVPKEYWVKKDGSAGIGEGKGGFPMRYLFLVDVTEGAINRGSLEAVVRGIKEALYGTSASEPAGEGEASEDGTKRRLPAGCKIGICTYDKEVQFYNLNVSFLNGNKSRAVTNRPQPALESAQMVVMPDIDDPFVPLEEGLLVDPYESR